MKRRERGTTKLHGSRRGRSSLALGIGLFLSFGCNTASDTGSSGEDAPDSDILVARSTDDGVTWTDPAALNVDAATDFGADEAPQLTTDGLGAWLAIWQSTSFTPLVRDDFDLLVSRSADDGATWTGQAELNSDAATDLPGEGDIAPQLTTDGAGSWVAVWSSIAGYNRPPPPPPEFPVPPDFDILVARSTDDGATWSAQVALNSEAAGDMGNDEHPQLTTDGAGTWLAVWNSNEGYTLPCQKPGGCPEPGDLPPTDHDILFARSTDDGMTWTAQLALNSKAADDGNKQLHVWGGTDKHPQATTDGAGTWVAVWESDQDYNSGNRQKDYDILFARSTDGGVTWSEQAALNSNAAVDGDDEDDTLPQLTTDGQGIWVAVWQSIHPLGGTIGTDADILFARSTDGGVNWTPAAALNTNATGDVGQDGAPQLTTDAQGTWIATWSSTDPLGDAIGSDADIVFARSTDGGVTWSAPAALNTNADGDDQNDVLPQLTTDGQGSWVAVWQSMESL